MRDWVLPAVRGAWGNKGWVSYEFPSGGGTGGDASDNINTDDTPDDDDTVTGDNTGGAGATGADTFTSDAGEVDNTNNAP